MDTPFHFLRSSEHQQLVNHAEQRHFHAEDVLIRQDSGDRHIVIVLSGTVRILRHYDEFEVELARRGAGEFFGEMSFVDGEPASADVIAVDDVNALIIKHEHIHKVVKENPAFYGRFYKSIAAILSERLRTTTGHVTPSEADTWHTDD